MGTLDLDQVDALEEVGVLEPEVDFKQFCSQASAACGRTSKRSPENPGAHV